MTNPFGQRGDGRFEDGPPKRPVPFEMPVAHVERKHAGLVGAMISIPIGVAIVALLYLVMDAQDPNRRREATAVIPIAPSATASAAPRRGAIARSASRKKVVVVNDFASDAEAEAAARESCGVADCVLVETFAASCVARAAGKGDRQEIAYGLPTREDAEKAALTKCGKACTIQASSCPEAR